MWRCVTLSAQFQNYSGCHVAFNFKLHLKKRIKHLTWNSYLPSCWMIHLHHKSIVQHLEKKNNKTQTTYVIKKYNQFLISRGKKEINIIMFFHRKSENTGSYNSSNLLNLQNESPHVWHYSLFMHLNKCFRKTLHV